MNTLNALANINDITVYDFFCPQETRSCTPVIDKRVYEACYAADIKTIGDLTKNTLTDLRSKSFCEDLLPYISTRLQNAYPGLRLSIHFAPNAEPEKPQAAEFVPASISVAPRGHVPACSFVTPEPLPYKGYAAPFLPSK